MAKECSIIEIEEEKMEMALQQYHIASTTTTSTSNRARDYNSNLHVIYSHHSPSTNTRLFPRFRICSQFRIQATAEEEVLSQKQLLYYNGGAEIEEEEEVDAYISEEEEDEESNSMLLSLSVKPDRNTALLDDYEMEELDFVPDLDPNHRSGKFSSLSLFYICLVHPNTYTISLNYLMVITQNKLNLVLFGCQTTHLRLQLRDVLD